MAGKLKPGLWNAQPRYTDPDWLWAWRGLVFAALPGGKWRHELVVGTPGTLLGSGTWRGMTSHGQAFQSTSLTADGGYWTWSERIAKITTDYTIIVWADPASAGLGDYSKLLTIPYRNGVWASPFAAISFGRNASTSNGYSDFAPSAVGEQFVTSSAGFIQDTDGLTMYVFTRSGVACTFYRNAVQFGTASMTSGTSPVDFVNKQPVVLLNHSNSDPGEGIIGVAPLAMIYNRALTAREIKALYLDPYAFVQIPSLQKFYPAGNGFSYEQEGYRFRNDDGSEITATWRQAQDTPDSIARLTIFRLRHIINTTGNTPSTNYRIEYRKTDSYDWRKVN